MRARDCAVEEAGAALAVNVRRLCRCVLRMSRGVLRLSRGALRLSVCVDGAILGAGLGVGAAGGGAVEEAVDCARRRARLISSTSPFNWRRRRRARAIFTRIRRRYP